MTNIKLHRVSRLGLNNKNKAIRPSNKFAVVPRLGLGVNTKTLKKILLIEILVQVPYTSIKKLTEN